MKVQISYDFENASNLEDFSKDKVNIEMSYEEWDYLCDVVLHNALNHENSKEREKSWKMYEELRKFSTKNLK